MPKDAGTPESHVELVGPHDRHLITQARDVLRRAYANSVTVLLVWAGSLVGLTGVAWLLDPGSITLVGTVFLAVVLYVALVVVMPLLLTTYAIRRPGNEMSILISSEGRAVVLLGPGRRHEPPTHRHVSVLAASPKRRGLGGALARHVRDRLRSQGFRLTATARPRLAEKYQKQPGGLVRHHSAEPW